MPSLSVAAAVTVTVNLLCATSEVAVLATPHGDARGQLEVRSPVQQPEQDVGAIELGVNVERIADAIRTAVDVSPLVLKQLPTLLPALTLVPPGEDVVDDLTVL